jgi:hypothetical protein
MNRASATSYLTEKYRELAAEAKFTAQQITDAYNGALDMSLRQLGYEESALATADVIQSNVLKYIACLNYYALDRFVTLFALRFDVKAGSGAIDAQRSQISNHTVALRNLAAKELTQYGIVVGGAQSFQMGRLTLDFLEPSTAWEF